MTITESKVSIWRTKLEKLVNEVEESDEDAKRTVHYAEFQEALESLKKSTSLMEALREALFSSGYITTSSFNGENHEFNQTEIEIIKRLKLGKSNYEIADELCLTIQTVKNYNTHIYKTFRVRSKSELIVLLQNQQNETF